MKAQDESMTVGRCGEGDNGLRGQRGMSLVEVLIAVLVMGLVVVGILPSFIAFADVNTLNEERTGAVQAAQTVMESLRLVPPSTMPTSGSGLAQTIAVGDHVYQVVTHYCVVSEFCDTSSRHLAVEVSLDQELIYATESVFTELR